MAVETDVRELATLIVTTGAVTFAIGVALWAWRLTAGARAARVRWNDRLGNLEARLERSDALFAAFPGLVLIWQDEDHAPEGWGLPRLYGSPTALASLLRFADASEGPAVAGRLLDGLADYEARDAGGEETTLRQRLRTLRAEGEPFSLTILGPSGRFLEADGRAGGDTAVLWLTDATTKGLEESASRGRMEEQRRLLGGDPLAFLEALDRSPLPAWRMSSGGKLVWANRAYLEAVEAGSLEDALREKRLLHADLPDLAIRALESGEPVEESRRAVIGGHRRILGLCLYPVSGGAGGVAVDITGEEEAREALERHVQAHDETLDHMAEAVAIFGPSRRMIFHNNAFAALFGLEESWLNERPTHAELLDRLREARKLPEQSDYGAWKAAEMKLYEEIPEETPEELWPLPDGRTLRVVRQRHPLGGLLLLFDNVTQELALRAQYRTLVTVQRATLDNLMEAVAVFGSDGRLRLRNAAFERMWGIAHDSLDDDSTFEDAVTLCRPLFHKEEVWRDIKNRVTDPSPEARVGQMGEMERTDNSVLTWISQPLPDGATVIAWADVTAAKREERMLRRHNEALQEADRQKTEFVKHVSYQLRTPLTTITGYADLLNQQMAGDLNPRQKEHVRSILSSAEQLAKLVGDILDIAAIEAGALELDLGDVRVDDLLDHALELVGPKAQEGRIKLHKDLAQPVGVIRADETRVKQVLYNLLTNAIRHTPEGGDVTLGAAREDDMVHLWVEDTGSGLSPEGQAKVFDRFESGGHGGAGLGLSLVRDFVEMHGGDVEFEAEEGKGARVTCWLPVNAAGGAGSPELNLSAGEAAE